MRSRLLLVVLVLLVGGCRGSRWNLWPGRIEEQQLRATVHDPYSDVDAGPEVVGGRPRDYQQPLPEPVRNRLFVDSWWGR